MTDKPARTHAQQSNRERPRKAGERKTVYKAVLDNPFQVRWPSVPVNLQNMIFSHLVSLLEGASNFHEAQSRTSRKRKRALEADKSKKKSKGNEDVTMEGSSAEGDLLEMLHDPCPALPLPPKPPILDHLVCGINAVTKRLEAQARQVRRNVVISSKPMDDSEAQLPISLVFVCRADVDPPILINHLPQLVAACNSVHSRAAIKLVPLPKESESVLAEKLGIRRASVLALDAQYPGIPEFSTRLESVAAPTAPWLMLQAKTSTSYEATHVKQLRTSAPKDMKAAKESRLQGKLAAKLRKQNRGNGEGKISLSS